LQPDNTFSWTFPYTSPDGIELPVRARCPIKPSPDPAKDIKATLTCLGEGYMSMQVASPLKDACLCLQPLVICTVHTAHPRSICTTGCAECMSQLASRQQACRQRACQASVQRSTSKVSVPLTAYGFVTCRLHMQCCNMRTLTYNRSWPSCNRIYSLR
jgi:hypothetical protein